MNTRYWDQFKCPPQSALKPIQAGRLKGKSDINPQWRMQAMTEVFGPVGIGWTYTIDRLWTEPGSDGQVCAFALVSVRIKDNGEWSEPVPGIGGSMLIEKESRGLYTSDEAFKMATTDALSVAMKAFGVAAEVYLGNLNGSKYNQTAPPQQRSNGFITRSQLADIEALIAETARTVVQMTGRGVRGSEDWCVSYVLDRQFMRWWNGEGKRLLPRWWRDAMVVELVKEYQ